MYACTPCLLMLPSLICMSSLIMHFLKSFFLLLFNNFYYAFKTTSSKEVGGRHKILCFLLILVLFGFYVFSSQHFSNCYFCIFASCLLWDCSNHMTFSFPFFLLFAGTFSGGATFSVNWAPSVPSLCCCLLGWLPSCACLPS